eukprot:4410109-Amphidinium_carterae.1
MAPRSSRGCFCFASLAGIFLGINNLQWWMRPPRCLGQLGRHGEPVWATLLTLALCIFFDYFKQREL